PLSADTQARLDQWLQADRRHQGAYLRARAGMHIMDRGLSIQKPALANDNFTPAEGSVLKRRRPVGVGRLGIAVGGVLAAGLVATVMIRPPEASIQAPVRQAAESAALDWRRQTLQDG